MVWGMEADDRGRPTDSRLIRLRAGAGTETTGALGWFSLSSPEAGTGALLEGYRGSAGSVD